MKNFIKNFLSKDLLVHEDLFHIPNEIRKDYLIRHFKNK